jgi:hypothetical protein
MMVGARQNTNRSVVVAGSRISLARALRYRKRYASPSVDDFTKGLRKLMDDLGA